MSYWNLPRSNPLWESRKSLTRCMCYLCPWSQSRNIQPPSNLITARWSVWELTKTKHPVRVQEVTDFIACANQHPWSQSPNIKHTRSNVTVLVIRWYIGEYPQMEYWQTHKQPRSIAPAHQSSVCDRSLDVWSKQLILPFKDSALIQQNDNQTRLLGHVLVTIH